MTRIVVDASVAIKWFLPEDLTIAIRYHHDPAQDPFHRSLSSLVHLADCVAWRSGLPSCRATPKPPASVDSCSSQRWEQIPAMPFRC